MDIKLTEKMAEEVLGEVRLINTKERYKRDANNQETDELEVTTYHLGSANLDSGSFSIRIESNKPSNIKPFGLVKLVEPVYSPRAQSGTIGNSSQTWAKVVDNFVAKDVLPLDDSQKIADENGEAIKEDSKKEAITTGGNKK